MISCRPEAAAPRGGPGQELCKAAWKGNEAAARALLAQGAVRPDDWRDARGRTALHIAARQGHAGVVRLLLDRGASVAIKDKEGDNALSLAAEKGHSVPVRMLLAAGAHANSVDRLGYSVLHCAARARADATVELLVLWGADPEVRNVRGQTPSDRAAIYHNAAAFDAAVARAIAMRWARTTHPRLPRPAREVVLTVMLCALRIATGQPVGAGQGCQRGARRLPAMPSEMWVMVLSMLHARDIVPCAVRMAPALTAASGGDVAVRHDACG